MQSGDAEFRKAFFRALTLGPLEPTSAMYVPLYELPELREHDPVELLRFAIESCPAPTVQLLSGFRGTGKSTELRRLRKVLTEVGHIVFLIDLEDYLNLAQPIDVVDFFFAFAAGLGDAAAASGRLDGRPLEETIWTRLYDFFMRTNVSVEELAATGKAGGDLGALKAEAALGLKLAFKQNPSFREQLKEKQKLFLQTFVAEVKDYVADLVQALRPGGGEPPAVVVLVDSIEHIRGTSKTAESVQSSVENLFTAHADLLHVDGIHIVYTVHPYLKIRYPALGALYEPGGVQMVPTVKVRGRAPTRTAEPGVPYPPALEALHRVIEARGPYWRLLGEGSLGRGRLDELSLLSGGHLRDLVRLLAEIVRRARSLPATEADFQAAINHVRSESLPIADDDALWLADIATSRETSLPSQDKLPALARFLDTHQVLCYRNGNEWFDVHPLIRGVILQQATDVRARQAGRDA